MLVISDGVFPLPAVTLATNADPADLAAWLDDSRVAGRGQVAAGRGRRSGGWTVLIDSGVGSELRDFRGRAVGHATGRRRHRSRIRDRRGAHPPARGPRWRAARRRAEGPAASGRADPPGGRRGRVLGVARFLAQHFWRVPDVLRSAEERFVDLYRSQLRPFEAEYEVAPGWLSSPRRRHPRAQRGPPGVRRRPADVPRRCCVPEPLRRPHCFTLSTMTEEAVASGSSRSWR